MKNKKVLMIIGIILFVLGISTCFAVSIFISKEDDEEFVKLDVRIERAGVCNPLKPVEDKVVSISDEIEEKLQRYWERTDKDKFPTNEMCDCIIGDYKLFVGEDEILYNLDLGYVMYEGKYVDISDNFHRYLAKVTEENDIVANEGEEEKELIDKENECCSCCPDAKPGETCIDACCPCS